MPALAVVGATALVIARSAARPMVVFTDAVLLAWFGSVTAELTDAVLGRVEALNPEPTTSANVADMV